MDEERVKLDIAKAQAVQGSKVHKIDPEVAWLSWLQRRLIDLECIQAETYEALSRAIAEHKADE
jgi:hypothetical protein